MSCGFVTIYSNEGYMYIYVYDIIMKRDLTLIVKCFTQYSTILFRKPIKFGIQDDWLKIALPRYQISLTACTKWWNSKWLK